MMRAFIAVKIHPTPTIRGTLVDLGELGRAVKPVSLDCLHVTLKFLGDTQETLLAEIAQAIEAAVDDVSKFEATLTGLGLFPHAGRPSVVWAGMQQAEPLAAIVEHLEERLMRLGFSRERRKFQPHLTLARVRGRAPRELVTYVEQNTATPFGSRLVESIGLYQSELLPTGARYTVLASSQLR